MVDVVDSRFEGVPIEMDDTRFIRCDFHDCELIYRGGLFGLDSCNFTNCVFTFDGPAGLTVEFLKMLMRMPGGNGVVETALGFPTAGRWPTLQ